MIEYLLIALIALGILGFIGWRLIKTNFERWQEAELIDVQTVITINPHKGATLPKA